MKTIHIIILACLVAGCANMTPAEKRTAWIVGGVVVTAVAISASDNDHGPAKERKVCEVFESVIHCEFR